MATSGHEDAVDVVLTLDETQRRVPNQVRENGVGELVRLGHAHGQDAAHDGPVVRIEGRYHRPAPLQGSVEPHGPIEQVVGDQLVLGIQGSVFGAIVELLHKLIDVTVFANAFGGTLHVLHPDGRPADESGDPRTGDRLELVDGSPQGSHEEHTIGIDFLPGQGGGEGFGGGIPVDDFVERSRQLAELRIEQIRIRRRRNMIVHRGLPCRGIRLDKLTTIYKKVKLILRGIFISG